LLNSTLTVQEGASNSHEGKGWGTFTTAAVEALNQKRENLAYVLWGAFAIKKAKMVNKNKNLVLSAPHPSPLSAYRGFFGSKPFSKIDEYLEAMNKTPINWEL